MGFIVWGLSFGTDCVSFRGWVQALGLVAHAVQLLLHRTHFTAYGLRVITGHGLRVTQAALQQGLC